MSEFKVRLLLPLLVLITISVSCKAQNKTNDTTMLRAGAWALEFGIGGNLTLTSFKGATIAAKYQIATTNAIIGGITLSGSTNNGNGSTSGASDDTSAGTISTSNSTKSAVFSIFLQYLWYMNPKGPVYFYIGLGPSISYSTSYYSNPYYNLEISNGQIFWVTQQYSNNVTQWSAGGDGIAGVEWFAAQWFSIHAEYNESILYQWGSTAENRNYSATNKIYVPSNINSSNRTSGWSLRSYNVIFGVNIYL